MLNTDDIAIDGVDTPIEEVDYILPDDYVEEDEADTDEIEAEEETTTEDTETESTEETDEESTEDKEEESTDETIEALEDLEIKVLGEVKLLKDIPRDELQSIARKGTDYDRIREKLDTAQDDINEWNDISKMFDMSPKDIKDALMDQHFKKVADEEDRNAADVKKDYFANRKSETDKMYGKFVDKYPDVKVDDLPQSVVDDIKMGKDVTKSYEDYTRNTKDSEKDSKITELMAKIEQLEKGESVKAQNTKSKKKGVIKKTSNSDATSNDDDFLAGLNGNY